MTASKVYKGKIANAFGLIPSQGSVYGSTITYRFYNDVTQTRQQGEQIPYPAAGTGSASPANPKYGDSGIFKSIGLNDQQILVGGMANISQFADVKFQEVSANTTSNIGFSSLNYTPTTNEAAWADLGVVSGRSGNAWFTPRSVHGSSQTLYGGTPGTDFAYYAQIHEIGHLLGLQHAFVAGNPTSNLPGWSGDENTVRFSVMSYTAARDSLRPTFEYQLYDIAALQKLYGRADNYNSGDNVYGFNSFFELNPGDRKTGVSGAQTSTENRYFSIWDGGGNDTIDASGPAFAVPLVSAAYIDLRPGYFSSIGPETKVDVRNGAVADRGVANVSIAFGSYIENATGTDFADGIIGNSFSNRLSGGGGDDLILGSGAAVKLANARAKDLGLSAVTGTGITDEELGDYTKIKKGGVELNPINDSNSSDELHGGEGNDIIVGAAGNVKMWGDAGDDKMMGGDGNDEFDGGSGMDTFWGNGGTDTAKYSSGTKPIAITYSNANGVVDVRVIDGGGDQDTLFSIEQIVATEARDTLKIVGNIAANTQLTIDANGGQEPNPRDTINAKDAGAVSIVIDATSGGGSVTSLATGGKINLVGFHTGIVGSNFNDQILDQSSGRKTISGGAGNDVISVADTTAGSLLIGGDGNDDLTGGAGNDVLFAGLSTPFNGDESQRHRGNVLIGGAGSDILVSIDQFDSLSGGDGSDYLSFANGFTSQSYGEARADGGAGDDIIDITIKYETGNLANYTQTIKTQGVDYVFKPGSGHDTILGDYLTHFHGGVGYNYSTVNAVLEGVDISQLKYVWDVTWKDGHQYEGVGDLAVVNTVTGDSFFMSNVYGSYAGRAVLNFPGLLINGSGTGYHEIALTVGSTASYDVARAAFAGQNTASPGGSGNDYLVGGFGSSSLSGGAGNDTFTAFLGSNAIQGGDGDDTLELIGSRDQYVFTKLDGSTTRVSSTVNDATFTISSVENVYFSADGSDGDVALLREEDVITGTAGDDNISGGLGDDVLSGGDGQDTLDGGSGADMLDGGAGADVMIGGTGNDSFVVDNAQDLVVEEADNGRDSVKSNIDYILPDNVEDLFLNSVAVRGTGNGVSNTISGNSEANIIIGRGGDDRLLGNAGNDIFEFDGTAEGVDEIDGGAGTDTIRATSADTVIGLRSLKAVEAVTANNMANVSIKGSVLGDTLNFSSVTLTGIVSIDAGNGNDTITGSSAADVIIGGAGDDILSGGAGNDTFVYTGLENGIDVVDGGNGTDTIIAKSANTNIGLRSASVESISANGFSNVSIIGSAGNDTLSFGSTTLTGIVKIDALDGNDSVTGSSQADTIYGGAGLDTLVGGSGSDTIYGEADADILEGGAGDDLLDGGDGDDTFRYTGTSGGFDAVIGGTGTDTLQALANNTIIGLSALTDVENINAGSFTGVTVLGSSSANILDFGNVKLSGISKINGGAGNDTITGSILADVLLGGAGDDLISGGNGNDTFQFSGTSEGFDSISGGSGTDTIEALANSTTIGLSSLSGVEVITGGSFTSVIISGSANADNLDFSNLTLTNIARIIGGAGNDTLTGNSAANILWGGTGNDIIQGGAGDDSLSGDDGDDLLIGGAGNDVLTGGNGTDTVDYSAYTIGLSIDLSVTTSQAISSSESDTLNSIENVYTGSGADVIVGSTASNYIKSGSGNDIVVGGLGNDTLDGGAGSDIAKYAGLKSTYSITTSNGSFIVKDNATTSDGNDGSDTIVGIETLQFKDGTQGLAAPIILDLNGDGVRTVNQANSKAKFDWDGDGIRDNTAWVGKGDGILVFDRNNDGKVNGANELSFIQDKPGAKSDLDGLSSFDTNNDGWFSALDEQWSSFKVWIDKDSDGKVDKREIRTLASVDVQGIKLAGTATEASWEWGDAVTVNTGSFLRSNGSLGSFSDVMLGYASTKNVAGIENASFNEALYHPTVGPENIHIAPDNYSWNDYYV